MEQRIRALLKMREDGDLAGLLSYAAPDIVYDIRGNWAAFPFSEPVRGKAMTAQALKMIAMHCENLGNVVHGIVIDGDQVAVRRTATIRHRGTGRWDPSRFRISFASVTDWWWNWSRAPIPSH